ncbi:hypothetical protein ACHAXS_013095 [Conticribra weissflogii]
MTKSPSTPGASNPRACRHLRKTPRKNYKETKSRLSKTPRKRFMLQNVDSFQSPQKLVKSSHENEASNSIQLLKIKIFKALENASAAVHEMEKNEEENETFARILLSFRLLIIRKELQQKEEKKESNLEKKKKELQQKESEIKMKEEDLENDFFDSMSEIYAIHNKSKM